MMNIRVVLAQLFCDLSGEHQDVFLDAVFCQKNPSPIQLSSMSCCSHCQLEYFVKMGNAGVYNAIYPLPATSAHRNNPGIRPEELSSLETLYQLHDPEDSVMAIR